MSLHHHSWGHSEALRGAHLMAEDSGIPVKDGISVGTGEGFYK